MHKTAFIITDEHLTDEGQQPSIEQLRRAARQAIEIAREAQGSVEGADYETFAIGCRHHRFIQGQNLTNSQIFGHRPESEWPQTSWEVMSQVSEPDVSDDGIRAIPNEVLENCWNSGRQLVTLALKNFHAQKAHFNDRALIYPDLLLGPDGILGECVGFPDVNVFGERYEQLKTGTADICVRFTEEEPTMAFHLAQGPLRKVAEAAFQAEYVRIMARHETNIVLEADWNM